MLTHKRIFFGSLSVLVPRLRDRWKLDLQFSHRSNFLFHPPTRDFKLVFETVVPGRTPARSKGNHCLFSVSSGAAVAMGDLALMSKTDWYCEVSLPESLKLFARRVSSTLETKMATRRRRGIRNPWVLPPVYVYNDLVSCTKTKRYKKRFLLMIVSSIIELCIESDTDPGS